VLLDGFVVGIEGGFEEEDGGDAAGHFLDVTDFLDGEGAAKERLLTVREPFFDDLASADGLVLDASRKPGPIGRATELSIAISSKR
jgi:hypothetical protein